MAMPALAISESLLSEHWVLDFRMRDAMFRPAVSALCKVQSAKCVCVCVCLCPCACSCVSVQLCLVSASSCPYKNLLRIVVCEVAAIDNFGS